MSSGRKRRSSSYKSHPLYGTIIKNSFSIDLNKKSSAGFTLYRIVFKKVTSYSPGSRPGVLIDWRLLSQIDKCHFSYFYSQDYDLTIYVVERETQEEKNCYVWQRFKNFQILSKKLEDVQKLSGDSTKLPRLINARYFDRFNPVVIEERIKSCVELLHSVSRQSHLIKSEIFIEFLSDFKYLEDSARNQSISEVSVSSVDTLVMDVAGSTQEDLPADDEVLSTSNPWDCKEAVVTCNPDHNSGDNLIQFEGDSNVENDVKVDVEMDSLQKPLEDSHLNVQISSPVSLTSSDDEDRSVTESYAKKLLSTSPEGLEWSTAVSLTPKGSDTEEDSAIVNQTQPSLSNSNPVPINSNLTVASSGTKESSSPPSWWNTAMQETDELACIDEMDGDKLPAGSKPVVDNTSNPVGDVAGLHLAGIVNKQPVDDIVMPQFSDQFSLQAPLSPEVDTSSPSAYLLQSGKMIREALELERRRHYSKAFEILKAGVGLLLRGVQMDGDPVRRDAVRKKISGYLRHAEKLYKQHVATKEPSQPHYISDFNVIGVLKKCMLVRSKHSGELFVVKALHKTSTSTRKVGKANKPSKNRSLFPCPFMVKFLHHYETTSSIYLLLEYVTGGNILEVVRTEKDRFVRRKAGISTPVDVRQEDKSNDLLNNDGDDALLSQLISPPNTSQSDEQLSVDSSDSEENSLTSLKALRRALEESGVDTSSLDKDRPPPSPPPLTIEPPTPTTPVTNKVLDSVNEELKNLIVNDTPPACTGEVSDGNNETKPFRKFSPGAVQRHLVEESELTDLDVYLEECIRKWIGQLVIALEHLHSQGVICRDLHPGNILISEDGDLKLTYFGTWDNIQPQIDPQLADQLYVAPELCGTGKPVPSVDWWSLGVILYETLTGLTLCSCHPSGISSHCEIEIPAKLSVEASSLIKQLLQVNPKERLGSSSMNGVGDIKSHPFFANFNWSDVIKQATGNH